MAQVAFHLSKKEIDMVFKDIISGSKVVKIYYIVCLKVVIQKIVRDIY